MGEQRKITASKVVACLEANPGFTAKDFARHLECSKSDVNPILYTLKSQGKVRQEELQWFLAAADAPVPMLSYNPMVSVTNETLEPDLPPAAFNPTEEQRTVIETGADLRLFVEAGPGTGKTDSLVARLRWLTTQGGLNPSQILVLSFSVAAIRELKKRIERATLADDGSLPFIDIRTFDSFASRLLRHWTTSAELGKLDYDQRIVRATEGIIKKTEANAVLGDYRHVLLDEMQDLVGVRADFAFELLCKTGCGFTLFGDSAQGIYDFQIDGSPSQTTSADLLKRIHQTFSDLKNSHRFTRNFRVGGNMHLAGIAVQGRALLLESPEKARLFLEQQFSALPLQGSTGAPDLDAGFLNSSTCVVCRTNGQVLRLAGKLREQNIPFQIARDKHEFVPPPWIGSMFLGWPVTDPIVRRAEFVARAAELLCLETPSAEKLWNELLSSFGPVKPSFNLNDLRAALTEGVVIPECQLFERDTNVIQLSTIHKSKGREFSNVIVVMRTDDECKRGTEEDRIKDDAEPKVLFVALTRAKTSLRKMEAKAKGIWMPDDRWIRSFKKEKFTSLSAFQVGLPDDIDKNSFAVGDPEDVKANQQVLLERARPGAPAEVVFTGRDKDGCPMYKLLVDKIEVASMSVQFGWALWHTLKNLNNFKPKNFPSRITGLWVKEIVTVIGELSSTKVDRSFLTSGFWLGVTLDGLGKCEW